MKKSVLYEILAITLMMVGAVLLVTVYYPNINPVQYRIDNHNEPASLGRYIIGTPISLLILSGSLYFNGLARKLKRDEKG
jgi:hypothetical protein